MVDGWIDGGQMDDEWMGRSINGWVDGTTLNYLLKE